MEGKGREAARNTQLCKEKDDALVEITLPDDANIYVSEYQLYLPDKKEPQKKLKEWIEEGPDL